MKIEAEQFVFPFDRPGQWEFNFSPSASIFDGWSVLDWFAWWAVLAVHSLPCRIRSPHAFFLEVLPVIADWRRRSGFCVLGVVTFR